MLKERLLNLYSKKMDEVIGLIRHIKQLQEKYLFNPYFWLDKVDVLAKPRAPSSLSC